MRTVCMTSGLWPAIIATAIAVPGQSHPKSTIKVAHENHIVNVFLGEHRRDGSTELVFEFDGHKFLYNQSTYSCIFVNGAIVAIREYNNEDSYVRGFVRLGDADQLTCYSGVLRHAERIDPHDHGTMWRAFVDSDRRPFVARREDLPDWWVSNPIRERKKQERLKGTPLKETAQQRVRRILASDGHPRLTSADYPAMVKEALAGNFRATWGLATSGYSSEAADTLIKIVGDDTFPRSNRDYAVMGLRNYLSSLNTAQRRAARLALEQLISEPLGPKQ